MTMLLYLPLLLPLLLLFLLLPLLLLIIMRIVPMEMTVIVLTRVIRIMGNTIV